MATSEPGQHFRAEHAVNRRDPLAAIAAAPIAERVNAFWRKCKHPAFSGKAQTQSRTSALPNPEKWAGKGSLVGKPRASREELGDALPNRLDHELETEGEWAPLLRKFS
jgi:hypothetical protein